MGIIKEKFDQMADGQDIYVYRVSNASGAEMAVLEYGAILVSLKVPDKKGKLVDVVLGYDDLKGYIQNNCFFGGTIGRNGNRIANAKFSIGEKEYLLAQNDNENNLHSGPDGFETKVWSVSKLSELDNSVTFSRMSPDGESGFPGDMIVEVTYSLTEKNEVVLSYYAKANADTVANMTNHSYFNLAGEGSGDILGHKLALYASYYTPTRDAKAIPTGEYAAVENTPMDFRQEKEIGKDIQADFEQIVWAGGYDHNYITDGYKKGVVRKIADAYCAESGISMAVMTDCPGVQFYTGNFVNNEPGKNGHIYQKNAGFCLETQYEPNSVNEKYFHSPILKANEEYHTKTIYSFGVEK